VSHIGLTLTAVALLDGPALGGAVVYALADGLVKGALFLAVGVLQHHLGNVDELALRGQGRGLWLTFGLFTLGALGLAGAPPFASFAGKALMEEAAAEAGFGWLAWLYVAVSALTLAALARATARVFLGWGPEHPAERPDDTGVTEGAEREVEIEAPRRRRLVTLLAPPAVLLAAALAMGLVPGLGGWAGRAAGAFTDTRAYAAAVLDGARPASGQAGHGLAHPGQAALLALVAVLLGLCLGLGALAAERVPARLREAAGRLWAPVGDTLRAAHSGHVGDSVMWLTVGVAGLGALLMVALR
jgi:multicomponent Na+:H+ antiporter subunit D